MKRLDLIISAIEDALENFNMDSYENEFHGCCGADVDVGHTADCKLAQALDAARELRGLEPVAWEYEEYRSAFMTYRWFDKVQFVQPPNDPGRFKNIKPLYALGDEK
jgi:hypothetical protein